MDNWNNHLTKMISLYSRAKNMEKALRLKEILTHSVSPSRIAQASLQAEDIKKLYQKAYRMCHFLQSTQPLHSKVNLEHICDTVESRIRRIDDVMKILDSKAKPWGFATEEEAPPSTIRTVNPDFVPDMTADLNAASDNPYKNMYDFKDENDDLVDAISVKAEVKHALRALLDIIDHMDTPTLLKVRRLLNKLVDY